MTALELADLIEERLALAPQGVHTADFTARRRIASELIAELTRDHGARHRSRGDDHFLKLAGISCSCTAGDFNLLHSWARKVRRPAA